MKIISIDVGIKNLAFCVFEKSTESNNFKITKWDTINISESNETLKCCYDNKCKTLPKFTKNNTFFCLKHSKKQCYQIPTSDLKTTYINKQKIQSLYEIADKHNIKYEKPIKKTDLISCINEHIHNNYFQEIKTVDAGKIDLITIGNNIKTKFNKIFSNMEHINYVIIENQISPIANRMKTIQGMIVQYFIMCDIPVDHIKFVSALNKLKKYDIQDNTKYSDRKKLSINKCLEIITNDYQFNEQLDYFNSHNKKDDLSDSFLQGIWYISEYKL
jgi:hypothetical protein